MHNRNQKSKEEQDKEEKEVEKISLTEKEEREIEVQKAIDLTLIREIEYLLAFLAFVFVAYLIHVIVLISKPPA
jgi:hypothetical protein